MAALSSGKCAAVLSRLKRLSVGRPYKLTRKQVHTLIHTHSFQIHVCVYKCPHIQRDMVLCIYTAEIMHHRCTEGYGRKTHKYTTHIHTYTHINTIFPTLIFTHTNTHTYGQKRRQTNTHTHTPIHLLTHTHTHTHTLPYTCSHTHTHTHTLPYTCSH